MGCDICLKAVEANPLKDSLVTKEMSHICASCNTAAFKRVFSLHDSLSWEAVLQNMRDENLGSTTKVQRTCNIFKNTRLLDALKALDKTKLELTSVLEKQKIDNNSNKKTLDFQQIEERVREILMGIDRCESDKDETGGYDGWWAASTGAEFGEKKLEELLIFLKENYI